MYNDQECGVDEHSNFISFFVFPGTQTGIPARDVRDFIGQSLGVHPVIIGVF